MLVKSNPAFLLASSDRALLATLEPLVIEHGVSIEAVHSAEAALAALAAPVAPAMALLDVSLPGIEIARVLAAANAGGSRTYPIVLISDNVNQGWLDRLAEGMIEDVIPRSTKPTFWQVRIDVALRTRRLALEIERASDEAALNAQFDRLTGIYNRDTILSVLFRETDRAQRMKSTLGLVLFDVDDFNHWISRLGAEDCDELLCQISARAVRLLRSYDTPGRSGRDEFLVAMPGCSRASAVMLAERLRLDVFGTPFRIRGETLRLSACFGISISNGRSPLVVLREAEFALRWAKEAGPESIQCYSECQQPLHAPVTFFSPATGDELLAW
jgi:diguanylate cyclase (GGDEF)-like protein